MGTLTSIQWAHHTFNPWRGCVKVSCGCDHCYAEVLSHRNPNILGNWGERSIRAIATEDYWQLPIKWDQEAEAAGDRRRVFCLSLGDIWEEHQQLDLQRERLFGLIRWTPHLDWLLLTKRPQNAVKLASEAIGWDVGKHGFPPNVWLGVSVEDHNALWRIAELMELKCSLRFLSLEPLLGDLMESVAPIGNINRFLHQVTGKIADEVYPFLGLKAIPDCDRDTGKIGWMIVGGESGGNARGCDLVWIAQLLGIRRATGCPLFIKQFGTHAHFARRPLMLHDKKGGDMEEWPEELRIREVPTVALAGGFPS